MTNRVLFVDDEATLLRSMDRSFGMDYEVSTAESGAEAVRLLEDGDAFAVVVTDMRMPGMDGVEFIRRARRVAPDSVYVMLTGNQDLATAAQAVNEGDVFRFLNKPCPREDLRQAIEDAIRHHATLDGERRALRSTCAGAVSMVTGVLERAHPDQAGAGATVGRLITRLCDRLGLEDRWEYQLAARLSVVGFTAAGDDSGEAESIDETVRGLSRAARRAAGLIERLPRLESVLSIIEGFPASDGSAPDARPDSDAAVEAVGASLLRVSLQAAHALRRGVAAAQMADEVRESLPAIPGAVHEALRGFDALAPTVDVTTPPPSEANIDRHAIAELETALADHGLANATA